jgi:hypothetical protein
MDGPQAQEVRTLIRWLKEGPPGAIPISRGPHPLGSLQAVSWEDAGDLGGMERLGSWHASAFAAFAAPAAPSGVRQWLVEQVLEAPERVLFWIRDASGRPVGHVGLANFDFRRRTVSLRDVVCDPEGTGPLAASAVETLRAWVRETLRMRAEDGQRFAAA